MKIVKKVIERKMIYRWLFGHAIFQTEMLFSNYRDELDMQISETTWYHCLLLLFNKIYRYYLSPR